MEYKVGDLLISKQYLSIMTKDDREEESDTNKIFLILKEFEDDGEGWCCELISQETGSVSEWNYGNIAECFNKV